MEKYSVFLTPAEPDFSWSESLIRELSDKGDTLPFDPHLTVYSGHFDGPDTLREAVTSAITGIGPLSLRIRAIGVGEEYFRSIYIEFAQDPLLTEVHERIRNGVPGEPTHELFPHLSLLYGNMELSCKEDLAGLVAMDRSTIRFDRVQLVTPGNPREGWRDTRQWRTLFGWMLGSRLN